MKKKKQKKNKKIEIYEKYINKLSYRYIMSEIIKEMSENLLFRYNEETKRKLKELMDADPELYPTKSQVIRSAIHYLYNKKFDSLKVGETQYDLKRGATYDILHRNKKG